MKKLRNFLSYILVLCIVCMTYTTNAYAENTVPVNVSVSATDVTVSVPLNVACVINPNEDNGFVHGDIEVYNLSVAAVEVGVLQFDTEAMNKELISPMGLPDGKEWDKLNAQETKKYLSIGLSSHGDNWLRKNSEIVYAKSGDAINESLGILDSYESGSLKLTAYYGRSVKEAESFSMNVNFVVKLADSLVEERSDYFSYSSFSSVVTSFGGEEVSGLVKIDSLTQTFYEEAPVDIKIPNFVTIDGNKYGVAAIGDNAFVSDDEVKNTVLQGLRTIELPEYLVQIGESSFSGLTSLEYIDIPTSVGVIMTEAFKDCSSLTDVQIRAESCYIGDNAFYGLANPSTIYVYSEMYDSFIYNGYADVSDIYNMDWDKTMLLITEADGVTYEVYTKDGGYFLDVSVSGEVGLSLPEGVANCIRNIVSQGYTIDIIFKEGVTSVSTQLQSLNTASIRLPDSIKELRSNAFKGNGVNHIWFGKNANFTTIPSNALIGLGTDSYIRVPEYVSEIEDSAFSGSGVKTVYLLHDMTFGEDAFTGMASAPVFVSKNILPFKAALTNADAKMYFSTQDIADEMSALISQYGTSTTIGTYDDYVDYVYDSAEKSLWNWDTSVLTDYQDLVDFCNTNGITRLYQCISIPDIEDNRSDISTFIEGMNTAGVEVWWTNGDPKWGINIWSLRKCAQAIAGYNEINANKFEGIVFDNEYYLLSEYTSDPQGVVTDFVMSARQVYDYCKANDIKVIQTVPVSLAKSYPKDTEYLAKYGCDEISVMAYVKSAILENVEALVEVANKANKPIEIIADFGDTETYAKFTNADDAIVYWKDVAKNIMYPYFNFSFHSYSNLKTNQ